MDAVSCIKTRRSIRKFLSKDVEWDKVGEIVEAGKSAPSSGNIQNWKFIIVLDPSTRSQVAEVCLQQHWMAKAPVQIIICAETEKAKRFYGIRGERLYSVQNCAAAVQNMLIAAHALGLGACWVGAFDEDKLQSILGIPEFARPQAVIPVGYADGFPDAPMQYSLENVVFLEGWGNRFKDFNAFMGYTGAKVFDFIEKGKEMVRNIKKKISKED